MLEKLCTWYNCLFTMVLALGLVILLKYFVDGTLPDLEKAVRGVLIAAVLYILIAQRIDKNKEKKENKIKIKKLMGEQK